MLFIAKLHRRRGQPADALALLTGWRDIFRSTRTAEYAAYSGLVIGILRNERGDLDPADIHLQRAPASAQTLGDPCWQACSARPGG
jgi:hypothetical protein